MESTRQRTSFLKYIAAVLFFSVIGSCASLGPTRSNEPFPGPYPNKFNQLADRNPLLAREIGKLPELQDGISESESKALGLLCDLYSAFPVRFDKAFNEMYQIGIPEIRKYCAPLQATFWLAMDGQLDAEMIKEYSLHRLLDEAWPKLETSKPTPFLTKQEFEKILSGIKDEQLLAMVKIGSFDEAKSSTIFYYEKEQPSKFTWSAKRLIENARKRSKITHRPSPRWSEYKTVVDRLNAPELVDHYQKRNFRYKRRPFKFSGKNYDPKWVFRYANKGVDCVGYAIFAERCLLNGGYDASAIAWANVGAGNIGHMTCLFKKNNNYYLLDRTSFTFELVDAIRGPFKDKASVHKYYMGLKTSTFGHAYSDEELIINENQ